MKLRALRANGASTTHTSTRVSTCPQGEWEGNYAPPGTNGPVRSTLMRRILRLWTFNPAGNRDQSGGSRTERASSTVAVKAGRQAGRDEGMSGHDRRARDGLHRSDPFGLRSIEGTDGPGVSTARVGSRSTVGPRVVVPLDARRVEVVPHVRKDQRSGLERSRSPMASYSARASRRPFQYPLP